MLFYALKRFAGARGPRGVIPAEKRSLNQKSSLIFASHPNAPSLPLVSLNLHSKASHSHGGCSAYLIVPSVGGGWGEPRVYK